MSCAVRRAVRAEVVVVAEEDVVIAVENERRKDIKEFVFTIELFGGKEANGND